MKINENPSKEKAGKSNDAFTANRVTKQEWTKPEFMVLSIMSNTLGTNNHASDNHNQRS